MPNLTKVESVLSSFAILMRQSIMLLTALLTSLGAATGGLAQSAVDDAGAGSPGPAVLYTGARLLTAAGPESDVEFEIENAAMLVEDGRIAALGPVGGISVPAGTTTVSLAGKTIMPAMIDAHAHLGYEGYTSWGAGNYSRKNLADHLDHYSYYGFSAVFSAGSDPHQLALSIQQDQQQGSLGGARFLFAAGMAPPGQGPNDRFLEQALAIEARTGMTVLTGLADTEQAVAAAEAVAGEGIPFIKIWVDDRGGSQEKLAPGIYRPLLGAARRLGLRVFVHQQYASDMPDLLEAGVNGFLHGRLGADLDRRLADRIAAAGAFVVPNLGLGELRFEPVADDPFLQETLPPAVVARLRDAFSQRRVTPPGPGQELQLRESMGHLLAAGVEILLGTDAGAVPDHFFGYTGHRELEIFVRLGMSPRQAIIAATRSPAQRLGLDDLGTLEVGKQADFIVLDANPLDDIRNTRSISLVFQGGRSLDRQALAEHWRAAGPAAP
ncbi:MAG: amidohydrolase family protein [Gammaproteobacteria bacterium]|nr:amidohydrolase family protein [Pseudomonadales bacterium]MCP5348093.1 amidohydrolase family protein [Pseudomonadales bacterium]